MANSKIKALFSILGSYQLHPCHLGGLEQSAAAVWTWPYHRYGWAQTHSDEPRPTVIRAEANVNNSSRPLHKHTETQGLQTMKYTEVYMYLAIDY